MKEYMSNYLQGGGLDPSLIVEVTSGELPDALERGWLKLHPDEFKDLQSQGYVEITRGYCDKMHYLVDIPSLRVVMSDIYFTKRDAAHWLALDQPINQARHAAYMKACDESMGRSKVKVIPRKHAKIRLLEMFITEYCREHMALPVFADYESYLRSISEFNGGSSELVVKVTVDEVEWLKKSGHVKATTLESESKTFSRVLVKLKKSTLKEYVNL